MQIATTAISTPVFVEAGVVDCPPWIDGWPGLEGGSPKPRGFLRSAQSSPGHPIPQRTADEAAGLVSGPVQIINTRTGLQPRPASVVRLQSALQQCVLTLTKPQDKASPKQTAKAVPPSAIAKTLVDKVLADAESPAKAWDAVLKSNTVTPDVLLEAVAILHNDKKFDVAVEAIQSGIRNNLAAAWMYDVLAMEMKLAKRPSKDIARVLQSRIDFTNADIPQLLLTVALLSRFEAWDEAMGVCREATELNQQLSESWLLARSVADKSKNPEHRVWARCGILMHVWTDDSVAFHDEARKVMTSIAAELDAADESPKAEAVRTQLRDASSVDLILNLRWVGSADLDLMVTEPGGEICSYRNIQTSAGGRFTHDDPGSATDGGAKRYEQYICRAAADGEYTATVRFVLGKVTGLPVLEIIRHAGTQAETRTTQTIKLAREDVKIAIPVKSK